ncbi:CDP-diglyceride synthetase [Halobacteroides halobius DSM 5150]|uniref:Phosphatidate cytidylyltransferase n=1 Tax=Halobacteroides halobius (strain ATCC 35273 / DSM 5150 / MD-1) TaxID=748449 RepID=L0K967_HALHC|nr:phosphatidate cytidylyltransferase [Halobacteroides halobius]AGB40663.1 CDP-diglyceride synthetase [Halobacteroides halobius DSM 5150]
MLIKRVLSTILGVPLLVLIFKIGGWIFFGFNLLVIAVGMNEYYKLVEAKGIKVNKILGVLLGWLLNSAIYFGFSSQQIIALLMLGLVIILLKQILIKLDKAVILTTATTYFGVFYMAGLFSYLTLLYNLQFETLQSSAIIIWLPILATWVTDTGAYFIGKSLGQNPLAPKISPNKTIEGAIGGVVSSILITILFSVYLDFGYLSGIVLGTLIGTFAQLGDLSESAFKRDAQIKDSGNLIPGHGGLLDRIDSLLFVLPVAYYYLELVLS